MSQATPENEPKDPPPVGPCDSVLDYAYGELTGDALEAFKAHLAGCDKCKAELGGLDRIRGAVKQALPSVEPPPERLGALHAQLMHAAAQRKPRRGALLTFGRRVLLHPSYAAAAAFVLVAGAVGLQWSRGRLVMEPSRAEAPRPAEMLQPTPPRMPQPAAPPVAAVSAVAEKKAREPAPPGARQRSELFLKTSAGGPTENPARRAASAKMKKAEAPSDDSPDNLDDESNGASAQGGSVLGAVGGRIVTGAPPPAARPTASATPPMTQAPPPPPVQPKMAERKELPEPPSEGEEPRMAVAPTRSISPESAVQTAEQTDAPSLRKQAEELASSGRCDEAVKLYQRLERQYPQHALTLRDRLQYVRCLRAVGSQRDLETELEVLKADKLGVTRVLDEKPVAERPPAAGKKMGKKAKRKSEKPESSSDAARPAY
jgi:hypothetical protein